MKKVIAMALSILVGAFGNTLVDKALEDRVSTLESKVDGLYDVVSATKGGETDVTEDDGYSSLREGMSLECDKASYKKMLLRNMNGCTVPFISPEILCSNKNENGYIEYFLYITDSSAAITSLDTKTSYTYKYDRDYTLHSGAYDSKEATVTVTCKGNTDPQLAGKRIRFVVDFSFADYTSDASIIGDNTIKSDGTFEYTAMYTCKKPVKFSSPTYKIKDIKIN